MTTELGPSARALLDAARGGMSPDAAAIKRMRAHVDATIAGGGAAAGLATAKLGLFAFAVVLAVGAGIYANHTRTADPPPRIDLPSVRNETSPPVVRPVTEPPAIEMDAMPMSRPRIAAPRIDDAPPAAPEVAPPRRIDLAREVELIDQAMAALRTNDAPAALRSIRTHAVETHGAGQLAEDAAAIEIEALCRLHDPLVTSKLEAFEVRFPRSAQRSRLTTSCP